MTAEEPRPRPGIAERLSEMIQVPTVAPADGSTDEAFERFVERLVDWYPLVHERLELERVDKGLLYRWPGTSDDAPAVLMAHIDVVPADVRDGWSHDPFAGIIEDGWVIGRGALDDKGPLVVILDAVENLLAQGFMPRRDVLLAFGGNEETFGDAARITSDLLHERGITPWIVIDEGGAVVDAPLPFLDGDVAMVGVAEKGIATIRLSVQTPGGHASTPGRFTAVGRLARAITRLTPGTFPSRAPVAVTRMLDRFADSAPGGIGTVLRRVAASPRLTANLLSVAGGETAAMVRTTIAPTMVEGGSAPNVLPHEASATLNLRIALGETVADAVRRVRAQIADRRVTVELVEGSDPTPEASVDSEQFALISRCIAASHPNATPVPYVVMAATDSRWFHRYTPQVFRFAPLKMTAEQRATIHGVNERVEVAELERGERFHRALISSL